MQYMMRMDGVSDERLVTDESEDETLTLNPASYDFPLTIVEALEMEMLLE